MNNGLIYSDYLQAANLLRCDVAAVKAVCEVEAPKGGFFPDGTPTTLFEGHKFHGFTEGKYDHDYPTISYPKWTRQFYGRTWEIEKARLELAIKLNREAALKSASWGKFQIMGFNHDAAGHETIQKFVNAMYKSEGAQLQAFVSFVIHENLDSWLRQKNWAEFARRYNGPAYKDNQYDTKLAQAFERHVA